MRRTEGDAGAVIIEPSRALGALIARGRSAKNLRQEDLARAVGIGTSSLRLLESGRSNGPSVFTVIKLLRALDIEMGALADLARE